MNNLKEGLVLAIQVSVLFDELLELAAVGFALLEGGLEDGKHVLEGMRRDMLVSFDETRQFLKLLFLEQILNFLRRQTMQVNLGGLADLLE